jgi:hypothetical protein
MRKIVFLSVLFYAIIFSGFCQKIEWSVLKKELVGTYVGELKKGLANGKGTAVGQDSYTGDFKKGLPDGQGIYTDSEGNIYKGSFLKGYKEGKGELTYKGDNNKESVLIGYWEADKYIGKEKKDPYEISNKTGGVNPRIFNTGEGNKVEITIIDPVSHGFITGNIFLIGQASPRTTFNRYYYEDATFPLEFDIQYTCRNKLGTASIANTIRIKINKPGNWVVTLNN